MGAKLNEENAPAKGHLVFSITLEGDTNMRGRSSPQRDLFGLLQSSSQDRIFSSCLGRLMSALTPLPGVSVARSAALLLEIWLLSGSGGAFL